jgi:chloride channel 3/4/5
MASSSQSYFPDVDQSASSSSRSQIHNATIADDSDDDDPVALHSQDHALLQDDQLDDNEDIVSFKRKQKEPAASSFPRFLSPFTTSGQDTPSSTAGTPRTNGSRPNGLSNSDTENANISPRTKEGAPVDWYVEGPGRRVGYENMTAIDWIFEYTKERQRLRVLYSNATGLVGYIRRMLDASQTWVLLILTGLASGLVAAGIDVTSDWLADLKTGYCSAGHDGGRFYLNRVFCCWGYDEWSQCRDWVPWSVALNVKSSAGAWFVEYIFFLVYSVSQPPDRK